MPKGRVLQVITRLIVGGAQETVRVSSELLRARGWEIEIAGGPEEDGQGSLAGDLEGASFAVHLVPDLVRKASLGRDLRAYRHLRGLMRRGGYDLVHTHCAKAGVLGRYAAHRLGIPAVHTVHGWSFNAATNPLEHAVYVRLERQGARWCRRLIVVSDQDRQQGLKLRIGHPAQYLCVRSGVDVAALERSVPRRAEKRAELGLEPHHKVAGTVIRLEEAKAPLDLLESAALAARHVPDARFVLVGDGPLMPAVKARLKALGLEDRLVLLGLRRDVPDLMAAFDVFVLSSHWEGCPRVIPEAMAAGRPVVATDVGGVSECVTEGENGYLVAARDTKALAERLVRVLTDEALAERLGRRGREMVGAEFGVETMAGRLDKLYEQTITVGS
jgi:glycosyltransferase involved in cell wall biosynthesis